MICRSILAGATAVFMCASACNNAAAEQERASKAQAEANDKIAQANKEADDKGHNAQAEADKTIAAAQANFAKLREDYRHDVTVNLADLDHKVADLDAKAKKSTGKTEAELDARLDRIRVSREVFVTDYKTIEGASAATWDGIKARLDKEWADLKAMVESTS